MDGAILGRGRQFEDLFLPYLNAAYSLARFLARDPVAADDIVQDAEHASRGMGGIAAPAATSAVQSQVVGAGPAAAIREHASRAGSDVTAALEGRRVQREAVAAGIDDLDSEVARRTPHRSKGGRQGEAHGGASGQRGPSVNR